MTYEPSGEMHQIWLVPGDQVAYFCRGNWEAGCASPAKMLYECEYLPFLMRRFEKFAERVLDKDGYEERVLKQMLEDRAKSNNDGFTPSFENYGDEELDSAQTKARAEFMMQAKRFARRKSVEFVEGGKIWFILTRSTMNGRDWK